MKKNTRHCLVALLFVFSTVFLSQVFAAEVTQIKGNKVMVNGISAAAGDQFFIVSSAGKKIGIIQIKQAKGNKAIAEILKGRGEVGASVVAKSSSSAAASTSGHKSEKRQSESGLTPSKKNSLGFLWGLGSHTFAMQIGPSGSAAREPGNLTGMSFVNFKGFYDYDLNPSLTIRAAAGVESFTAKGSIVSSYCDGSSPNCSVDFMYFALEGSAHFNYITGSTRAWLGLGYSFLASMQSKKTIPNLEAAGTNQMILFSTGVDFAVGNKGSFIPLAVEYGLFPGSADVKASSIYLRLGYGFPF